MESDEFERYQQALSAPGRRTEEQGRGTPSSQVSSRRDLPAVASIVWGGKKGGLRGLLEGRALIMWRYCKDAEPKGSIGAPGEHYRFPLC